MTKEKHSAEKGLHGQRIVNEPTWISSAYPLPIPWTLRVYLHCNNTPVTAPCQLTRVCGSVDVPAEPAAWTRGLLPLQSPRAQAWTSTLQFCSPIARSRWVSWHGPGVGILLQCRHTPSPTKSCSSGCPGSLWPYPGCWRPYWPAQPDQVNRKFLYLEMIVNYWRRTETLRPRKRSKQNGTGLVTQSRYQVYLFQCLLTLIPAC